MVEKKKDIREGSFFLLVYSGLAAIDFIVSILIFAVQDAIFWTIGLLFDLPIIIGILYLFRKNVDFLKNRDGLMKNLMTVFLIINLVLLLALSLDMVLNPIIWR